jgi:hypothetical protein
MFGLSCQSIFIFLKLSWIVGYPNFFILDEITNIAYIVDNLIVTLSREDGVKFHSHSIKKILKLSFITYRLG